ncbi:hypothetical protein MYU51_002663 [Penicillium brevicompactum]|uniref:uncharacterized protein n=1 Tax=Penicillium brevicompactum TaxID=5074 RepID=UPI0025405002|nr:uncharacterized protein N7506_011106 [Penicillium brevicompactum]KAJ5321976.1 hypothetical protein N7506_011106 [Penicillium brevicompactum]
MALYEEFAWKETKHERWERDIDEAEQFYTTLARRFEGTGRSFFAMTAYVSFSVSEEISSQDTITALKKAWLQLRYEHPTIASWVEYQSESKRCKKIYETFQSDHTVSHQAWLDETFRIVSNGQTGKEWCNSDPPVPKLPTLFLIRRTNSPDNCQADVVLRSQHDIVDGMGSLHILNNLFKYASLFLENPNTPLPKFGTECKNLSPPLRVAASIPTSLEKKQELRLKKVSETNASIREGIEIAKLPFRQGQEAPGRHQRVELNLDLEQSKNILRAIKSIGASVTHVYHAAIALVLRDLQYRGTSKRKVRYINYSLINERPNCKEPYSTPQHAATVYHSVSGASLVIDMDVPSDAGDQEHDVVKAPREEFLEIVEQIKEYYLRIRDDKEHISLVPHYWALSTPAYPAGPEVPPIPAQNEAPSVSISSLGMVDHILKPSHGQFELESPWVTGEELGRGFGLFLGTFRGRMCLSAAYNDAWHDENEVSKFLRDCNELVALGLGV